MGWGVDDVEFKVCSNDPIAQKLGMDSVKTSFRGVKSSSSPEPDSITTFTGSDVQVLLNHVMIPFVTEITFENDLINNKIIGTVKTLVNNHLSFSNIIKELSGQGPISIELQCVNEYGDTNTVLLSGVVFTKQKSHYDTENIFLEDIFEFNAKALMG